MDGLNFYPVFVDHISPSVNPGDLRMMFSNFGSVVEVVLVSDYGFVNMADEVGALRAISNLNGEMLHQRRLYVDHSEELKDHFDARGQRYVCTRDPNNGYSSKHPPYPAGENIPSPFPSRQQSNRGDYFGSNNPQMPENPWIQNDDPYRRSHRDQEHIYPARGNSFSQSPWQNSPSMPETPWQNQPQRQQDNQYSTFHGRPDSYGGQDSFQGGLPVGLGADSVGERLRKINEKLENVNSRSSILDTRQNSGGRSRSRSRRSSRRSSPSIRSISRSGRTRSRSKSRRSSRSRSSSRHRSRSKAENSGRTIEMDDDGDEIESWEVPNDESEKQTGRDSPDLSNALTEFFDNSGADAGLEDLRIDIDSIARWRAYCLETYRFSNVREESTGTRITFTYDRDKLSDEEVINLCEIKGEVVEVKKSFLDVAKFLKGASQQRIIIKLKPDETFNQFYWINKNQVLVWYLGQDMQCYNCLENYQLCPSNGNAGRCRKEKAPRSVDEYMKDFKEASGYKSLEDKYGGSEPPPPEGDEENPLPIPVKNRSGPFKKIEVEGLTSILGTVHSILEDKVILSFYYNVKNCKGKQYAKLEFDQMYINGKFNLGGKGDEQANWPKKWSCGKKVVMDLIKLKEEETIDTEEVKIVIGWSVPLICPMGNRPDIRTLTIKKNTSHYWSRGEIVSNLGSPKT